MKARHFSYLLGYSFVLLLVSVIFFPPTPAQAQWTGPRFNLKLVFFANYQQVWGDKEPDRNYQVKVQLSDGQNHELSCNTTPYGRTQVGADEQRGEVPREVLAQTTIGRDLLKNPYPWGACIINWPGKFYPYYYNNRIENPERWYDFQTKTTPRSFEYAIPVQTLSYAGSTAINPQTNLLTKCRKLHLAMIAYGPAGSCQTGSQRSLGSYRVGATETTGSGGGGTQTIWSEAAQSASTIYVHYYFNIDPRGADEKAYPGAISPTKFRQNVVNHLDKKMNKIVNGKKIYHKQFFSTLMFLDGLPIIYVPDRPVYFTMVKPTERYKYMDSKLARHYIPTGANFLRRFEDGSLTIVNSGKIDAKTSADFYKKSGLKWLEFHRQLSNRGVNFLKSMQLPLWPSTWDLLLAEIPGLRLLQGAGTLVNGWRVQSMPAMNTSFKAIDVGQCATAQCGRFFKGASSVTVQTAKKLSDLANRVFDFGDGETFQGSVAYFVSRYHIGGDHYVGARLTKKEIQEIIDKGIIRAKKMASSLLRQYRIPRSLEGVQKYFDVELIFPGDKFNLYDPKETLAAQAAEKFNTEPWLAAFTLLQDIQGKRVAKIFINYRLFFNGRALEGENTLIIIMKEVLNLLQDDVSRALKNTALPLPNLAEYSLQRPSGFRNGAGLALAERMALARTNFESLPYAVAKDFYKNKLKKIVTARGLDYNKLQVESFFHPEMGGLDAYRVALAAKSLQPDQTIKAFNQMIELAEKRPEVATSFDSLYHWWHRSMEVRLRYIGEIESGPIGLSDQDIERLFTQLVKVYYWEHRYSTQEKFKAALKETIEIKRMIEDLLVQYQDLGRQIDTLAEQITNDRYQ